MNNSLLTIGIPTFNRSGAIYRCIQEILKASPSININVIIIDNASSDGTFEFILPFCFGTNIKVLKNPKNIGFTGSFIRLFEECETDYLMIISDEDAFILENIKRLLLFIEYQKPFFISPQAIVDGRLYRGHHVSGRMMPEDYRDSSFYISGLTFQVFQSKVYIEKIKNVVQNNSAAEVYPQVLLAASLIIEGQCFWLNYPVTNQMQNEMSYVTDSAGGEYYHVTARWSQCKGFIDYFYILLELNISKNWKLAVHRLLNAEKKMIFNNIRDAISSERPDLIGSIDEGARSNHGFGRIKYRVLSMINSFNYDPIRTLKRVIRKFITKFDKSNHVN